MVAMLGRPDDLSGGRTHDDLAACMIHVLDGYVVILLQMLGGVVVGTFGVLGKGADAVLNRLAFTVLAPCLLYTVTFRADLGSILSSAALVAALSAGISMVTFVVTARL